MSELKPLPKWKFVDDYRISEFGKRYEMSDSDIEHLYDRIQATAQKPPILVKDVFARAYGELPEGATCHAGECNSRQSIRSYRPILRSLDGDQFCTDGSQWRRTFVMNALTPDIGNEPAAPFAGFFDDRYRQALAELMEGV